MCDNESLYNVVGRTLQEACLYGGEGTLSIDGMLLIFNGITISLSVNVDDDTIICRKVKKFPKHTNQMKKSSNILDIYFGRTVAFVWEMKNQGGLNDAIQIMFGSDPDGFHIMQVMAVSSTMSVFSLSERHLGA